MKKPTKIMISMRLDEDIIQFFKTEASKQGVPYQRLINLCLRNYVEKQKRLEKKNKVSGE